MRMHTGGDHAQRQQRILHDRRIALGRVRVNTYETRIYTYETRTHTRVHVWDKREHLYLAWVALDSRKVSQTLRV